MTQQIIYHRDVGKILYQCEAGSLRGAVERAGADGAHLERANLENAHLEGAHLENAHLERANLEGANLDFSCWPLWCGSFGVVVDARLAAQLAYHFCRVRCNNAEVVEAQRMLTGLANKFHRANECGRIAEGGGFVILNHDGLSDRPEPEPEVVAKPEAKT